MKSKGAALRHHAKLTLYVYTSHKKDHQSTTEQNKFTGCKKSTSHHRLALQHTTSPSTSPRTVTVHLSQDYGSRDSEEGLTSH